MDGQDKMLVTTTPTASRPLLGLTVLVVEDSRLASEAVRLLCLRSGARIRRADSLTTAARHLAVYRPSVVLVDLGLPDGSGLDLIAQLARAQPRIPVILGISGDTGGGQAVMSAGADGFLAKPVASLAAFQAAILQHLPADRQPPSPRAVCDDTIEPDQIAYRDDLIQIARMLGQDNAPAAMPYVTQFLNSVLQSAGDPDIDQVLATLDQQRGTGPAQPRRQVAVLAQILRQRIAKTAPI